MTRVAGGLQGAAELPQILDRTWKQKRGKTGRLEAQVYQAPPAEQGHFLSCRMAEVCDLAVPQGRAMGVQPISLQRRWEGVVAECLEAQCPPEL